MKTRNIIFFLIGLLVFCSCDDMFEPAKENHRQLEDLSEESAYAHGLLMYAYDHIPDVYRTTTTTDVATDDAVTNLTSNNSFWNIANGAWTADNSPVPVNQWNNCKDAIQYINLFLTIVDKVKWAPSAASKQQMFVDRLRGEALGLRAVYYYYLLQAHGGYADDGILYGVPLLTEPEDGSSDYNQPRATFSACVQQCLDDCNQAISLLPVEYVDLKTEADVPQKYRDLGAILGHYNSVFGAKSTGLISGQIAAAVKAQVALLAASPAFRDGQDVVSSAQAAEYCADVLKHIDGLNGFDKEGNVWYRLTNKLKDDAPEMAEILWRAPRSNDADQEGDNYPPTLYGKGRVNPSQNLVDAFPMRNGRPITDASSGYDENDPYAGRDPRLANCILYNGMTFKKNVIVTGKYANEKGETTDNINDIATSTRTGYYLKKLLREDVSPSASGSTIAQNHIYPRIRYTEIFLAYAEAANDAWGPKVDGAGVGYTAYDVIKAIRDRAGLATNEIGMPLDEGDVYLEDCASDKAKMTELIRNERRLELCFENKRFWDMRRWKLALDKPIIGMEITKIDKDKDPTPDNLKYTRIDVEERKYDNSYQWYGPIPKSEVLRWSNLKQNKGW